MKLRAIFWGELVLNRQDDIIVESELQAYVDGQLQEPRYSEVESYLGNHPEISARLATYTRQNNALRKRYSDSLTDPLPDQLLAKKRRWPSVVAIRSAAAVLFMLIGGLLTFSLQSVFPSKGSATMVAELVQPAVNAHVVFSPEILHPVEVKADQQKHLFAWLSKRLDADIHAPDLTSFGYTLMGGRLLPSTHKPAAQFMYESKDGHRISLYIRIDAWNNQSHMFKYVQQNNVSMFYWIDGSMGYALAGDIDKPDLLTLAGAVHTSLSKTID